MKTQTNAHPLRLDPALVLALSIVGFVAPADAQSWIVYDASLGTMPQAQGWTLNEDINPPAPYVAELGDGQMHLSTLDLQSGGVSGGGVWWQRDDVPIDFANEYAVEVTVRIASAPNHSVNPTPGWPRPGYALAVYDIHGRIFWIGLGSGEVFLSNTAYGQYGSANTVTLAFNTTDTHHTYRIERAAGGTGAALRIDGVIRLQLPALGAVEGGAPLIYFGDPTYWANSESYTSSVRFMNAVAAVGPPSRSVALSAKPLGSPATKFRVAYGTAEPGELALEVFDTSGRRIERVGRHVAAEQSGSFEVPGDHRAGLYYYRLRLVAPSGVTSEVSGRIVLIR